MKCKEFVNYYSSEIKEKMVPIFNAPDFRGMLNANEVEELTKIMKLSEEELIVELLNIAMQFAVPVISEFRVGAIAKGESGKLYLGANQEFLGETLSFTLHAEQAAMINALTNDERKITTLASTYCPCCLCRQYMLELNEVENMKILVSDKPYTISDIVPFPFGPADLDIKTRLLQKIDNGLLKNEMNYSNDPLFLEALSAANKSYAPYTKSYSGVSILAKDDRVFTGRYAENVAFNISTNPMMAGLSNLNMSNLTYKDISRVVIVESMNNIISQIKSAENLLYAANPDIELEIVKVD